MVTLSCGNCINNPPSHHHFYLWCGPRVSIPVFCFYGQLPKSLTMALWKKLSLQEILIRILLGSSVPWRTGEIRNASGTWGQGPGRGQTKAQSPEGTADDGEPHRVPPGLQSGDQWIYYPLIAYRHLGDIKNICIGAKSVTGLKRDQHWLTRNLQRSIQLTL